MLMLLIGAMIIMRGYPGLPLAHLLQRWLVEWPAERLGRVHPAQLIFLVVVAGVLLAGGEVILLLGGAEAAVALSWQLSLYLDAGIAVAAASALARIRPILAMALHRSHRRPVAGSRRRRARTATPSAKPANDDDRPVLAA